MSDEAFNPFLKKHLVVFWKDGVMQKETVYMFDIEGSPMAPFDPSPIRNTGIDFRFYLIT